jgi:hypothetical protein
MRSYRVITSAAFISLACLVGAVGCSDDSGDSALDQARDVASDVKENANDTAARAVAEAYRAALKAKGGGQSLRTVTLLNEAADTLPGSPDISGITDSDGDGLDDDGKVQVKVNSGQACVTVPATGDLVDVNGGAC